jgi:hypothetical protein
VQLKPPFRAYDPERDREATHRIWREVGWLKKGREEAMDRYVRASRALVAEIDGTAECLVLSTPGSLRYLDEDLPFACVIGVTTSYIARRQKLAGRLAARLVAADALDGALVTALGMFEQGFYNKLGFGTGTYEIFYAFDPAHLRVPVSPRVPCRITPDDWEEVHAARLARRRRHGACNLTHPEMTRMDMDPENCFGLGYRDPRTGALGHHIWCRADNAEHGPYCVVWMAYRTLEEFLELMALIQSLGDQVRLVRLCDPPGIQLQDLLDRPFQRRQTSKGGEFESNAWASAWWQARILDLPGCLARTRLPWCDLRFNLSLHDPIEQLLDEDAPWRGVGGEYVVTLGPESSARRGHDPSLPVLQASVNAFTRMWLGVVPATGLATTDDLSGPPELLEALEAAFRLPLPRPDWPF